MLVGVLHGRTWHQDGNIWRVRGRLPAGVCQDLSGCGPRPQCLLCHRGSSQCHQRSPGLHLWPARPRNDRCLLLCNHSCFSYQAHQFTGLSCILVGSEDWILRLRIQIQQSAIGVGSDSISASCTLNIGICRLCTYKRNACPENSCQLQADLVVQDNWIAHTSLLHCQDDT